jgi:hypothetical protein
VRQVEENIFFKGLGFISSLPNLFGVKCFVVVVMDHTPTVVTRKRTDILVQNSADSMIGWGKLWFIHSPFKALHSQCYTTINISYKYFTNGGGGWGG